MGAGADAEEVEVRSGRGGLGGALQLGVRWGYRGARTGR